MGAVEFPENVKKKIVASTLKRGDLLVWEKYKFDDGTTKDKLVLVMSECIEDMYYTIALPTSRIDGYMDGRRQLVDTVCFPRGEEACFPLDTVIDLKNLDTVTLEQLAQGFGKEVAFSRCALSRDGLIRVMDMVKNAYTLTPKQKTAILEGWS